MSLDSKCVKEADFELDLNEAYEECPYTEYEIKSEVDIGPELLQAPSIYLLPDVQEESTHDVAVRKEKELKLHSSFSVRPEHHPISKLHKTYYRRRLERPKTCEYCQRTFKQNYLVRRHQKVHVKQLLYNNDDNIAAKIGFIKTDTKYTCDICLGSFIDESHLMKHMQIHGLELSTLTKQSEENLQKRHPERFNIPSLKVDAIGTRYFCVTCAKILKVSFDLFVEHLLIHIDENPLMQQILKEFVSSNPIERSCFGRRYFFNCLICNYSSHNEGVFRKHVHMKNGYTYCKSANETNDSSPPVIATKQSSTLATALTSKKTQEEIYKETMATDTESIDKFIDFQKSSLISRLALLNKVVGK